MSSKGIMQRLNSCIVELSENNNELKALALRKAICEKVYKVKQAEEILRLKTEKYPEALIIDIVNGSEEIAELRLQRDLAMDAYNTCVNSIQNLILEVEAIRTKLKWLKAEINNW